MPTTTSTTKTATSNSLTIIPLKAGHPLHANKTTTTATLRSLYNRAARAFLHRDVAQTHSLLTSAFAIIQPPSSYVSDSLATHRRKWDILRITLETTIYASPTDNEVIPSALQDNLTLSSQILINTLYERSLVLFTPTSHSQKPSSAFLPSQVLITLVLSSMKLDCPDVGRSMIEHWFAKRGQFDESPEDGEGYEKVLDIYCLHVLPRIEEWDYAREFLQYESELPQERRKRLTSSLEALYSDTMEARRPPAPSRTPTPANPIPLLPRSASPAPSASSSSSSLSTASTHTAVPRTPRPNALIPSVMSGFNPSASSVSVASDVTVTKRHSSHSRTRHASNGNPITANGSASISPGVSSSSTFRPPRLEPPSANSRTPSTLALIRASLAPYLTASRLTTFLLLFVLLPLMSLVMRIRRQRRTIGTGTELGAADVVRRRLANGQRQTTIGRIWGEVVKAVSDTVRMGGGGLV